MLALLRPMEENSRVAAQKAQAIAWDFLKVNSNLANGSVKYHDCLAGLERHLAVLHEDLRSEAMRYLRAMERVRKLSTVGSWRPYILCILKVLGVPGCAVERARRDLRLGEHALQRATEEAEKDGGTEPAPKRQRRGQPLQAVEAPSPQAKPLLALACTPHRASTPQPASTLERFFRRLPGAPPEPQSPGQLPAPEEAQQPSAASRGQGAEEPQPHPQPPPEEGPPQRGQPEEPRQEPRQDPPREDPPPQAPPAAPPPPPTPNRPKRGRPKRQLRQAQPEPQEQQEQRPPPPQEQQPTGETPQEQQPTGESPHPGDDDAQGAQGSAGNGSGTGSDPKGYYATLKVSNDASPETIRRAYRRLALQLHPDKGGTTAAFLSLVYAFDILSNPESRERYDRECGGGGGGGAAAPGAEPQEAGTEDDEGVSPTTMAAKAAYAQLLMASKEWWEYILKGLEMSALEQLAAMMEPSQEPAASRRSSRGSRGQEPPDDEEGAAEQDLGTGPGIKKRRDGTFWIQVGWQCFKACAYTRPRSIEQAVRVHCAMTAAREAALRRKACVLKELKHQGYATKGPSKATDFDDIGVLNHQEWMAMLAEEPGIIINFSSDLNNPRIQTSWTPSLDSALEFRAILRRAREQGFANKQAIDNLKSRFASAASADKKARIALGRELLQHVSTEVGRRRAEAPSRPPAPMPAAAASGLQGRPEVLAIKEVSAAAEVERLKEALEKEKEGRIAALEDLRKTSVAWRCSSERAQEERQQALEEASARFAEREHELARRAEEAEQKREKAEERVHSYQDQVVSLLAQAKEEAKQRPVNPFRRFPLDGASTSEGIMQESVRAAAREAAARDCMRNRRLHVGGTALEPRGSYGLFPPRRPVPTS